jgi:two-component system, chemotaxis family, response regulator Rcp1
MREIHVLLAEDNRGDVLLVREALTAHHLSYTLHVASDGAQAVDFVARMGQPGEAPCPDILLLDLNLPRVDGHEVLREFRRHPDCATTPVIVVSSSDSPRDREKVSALGVARYFRKPTNLDAFLQLGALVKELTERADPGNRDESG